jgi:hypothetical protein
MQKRLKILITIAIILAAIFIYAWYSSGNKQQSSEGVVPIQGQPISSFGADSTGTSAGKEIVKTLSLLKSVTIDSDFFNGASFKGLSDFSIQLTPVESGRDNPFAPLD